MKKIKTAEKYIKKHEEEIIDSIGDSFYQTISYQIHEEIIKEIIKQAQLDMLEYAVNKCLSNAECELGEDHWGEDVANINEQSILKTIDEIKKELE